MTLRAWLPRDTTALALGADGVAADLVESAARRSQALDLVRNGSRGAFWLEPLLEVEHGGERIGFGPLAAADVPAVLAALSGGTAAGHPLYLGAVDEIPWLRAQRRLTFLRAGLGDPLCLDNYREREGFAGLARALDMAPGDIVEEVSESGLRGRGGAALPGRAQVAHGAGYARAAEVHRL